MIELWVDKYFLPNDGKLADNNVCQKVLLPDACIECGNKLNVRFNGDSTSNAYVSGICDHYNTWAKVWNNRIKEGTTDQQVTIMGSAKVIRTFANKIDPAQDGMKCSGSCGNWMLQISRMVLLFVMDVGQEYNKLL